MKRWIFDGCFVKTRIEWQRLTCSLSRSIAGCDPYVVRAETLNAYQFHVIHNSGERPTETLAIDLVKMGKSCQVINAKRNTKTKFHHIRYLHAVSSSPHCVWIWTVESIYYFAVCTAMESMHWTIRMGRPLLSKRIVHMCASPNRCSESHVSRCHQHRRKSFFW